MLIPDVKSPTNHDYQQCYQRKTMPVYPISSNLPIISKRRNYPQSTSSSFSTYSYPHLSYSLALFCILTISLFAVQVTALCRWEHCRQLEESSSSPIEESDLWLEDPTVALEVCQALDSHSKCLKASAKSCRGNLRYYSYIKGLSRVMDRKNCTEILKDSTNFVVPTRATIATTTEPLIVIPAFHGCSTMNLQNSVAYCAVFGDAHVVTQHGQFQNCRIRGAYPLIENRHLAIQVSTHASDHSHHTFSSSLSTITRITIIIKSSECSDERKTYEASINHLLPYFTDASSDTDSIKLIEHHPNKLLELRILHLKTIIFIRQSGPYLSLSIRLPAALLLNESAVSYQLCSAGCLEAVDHEELLKDQPLRSVQYAERMCGLQNLTHGFYEACVVDRVTSGSVESVECVKEAQSDWERLAPVDYHGKLNGEGRMLAMRNNGESRVFGLDVRWCVVAVVSSWLVS